MSAVTLKALVLVALLVCAVFADQRPCIPNVFGGATPYNLFSLGNVYGCNSDVEGRVALYGDATFTSYSIGLKAADSTTENSLVASGAVTYNHGTVWHGPIAVDAITATSLGIIIGGHTYPSSCCTANSCGYCSSSATSTSPVNFPQEDSYLTQLSSYYTTLPTSTGASAVASFSTLTLTCNNALDYNVFSGIVLTGITSLRINCAASTSVLVNFASSVTTFQNLGMSLSGGIVENKVVYHFTGATLNISGVGVLGTVFAPGTTISFNSGVVQGNVISGQFGTQTSCNVGQVNQFPFNGCLPPFEVPLYCCTYSNGDFTNGFCSEDTCFALPGWTVTSHTVDSCDECCPCASDDVDDIIF